MKYTLLEKVMFTDKVPTREGQVATITGYEEGDYRYVVAINGEMIIVKEEDVKKLPNTTT